jgi:hypothetical protein
MFAKPDLAGVAWRPSPCPAGVGRGQDISWIYCGDKIDPAHEKYIKEWEAANRRLDPRRGRGRRLGSVPGQGHHAGRRRQPGGHGLCRLAHAEGVRAERPDRAEVPMTDEKRPPTYPHIVETVTFDGKQWGVPVAFSTKALYWNKDLFKEGRARPGKAADHLGRGNRIRQEIKEKTKASPVTACRQDLRQHHAPVPALGVFQQRHGDRRRRQDHARQPAGAGRAEAYKDITPIPRKARPPTSRTKCAPSSSTASSA